MAAVLKSTRINIKDVSSSVRVAEDPKARLMYYLNCVCSVLDLSDEQGLRRLRDYQRYRQLSSGETDALLAFCVLFSPDVLLDKCFFHSEDMCGTSSNKFLELTAAQQTLAVTNHIVIGNQTREVSKIMVFKMAWLQRNYFQPMAAFRRRLTQGTSDRAPLLEGGQREEGCSLCCCISSFFKGLALIICCPILCPLYFCCKDD